jgi:hypothetical protein
MHLYFKTPQGNTVEFETDPDFLPSQLIKALARELSLDANSLEFGGVVLDDSRTIREYGINDEDTISIVLGLPSGSEVDSASRDMLVDMGFEASQVVGALEQSQGNFEIALELLTAGNIREEASGPFKSYVASAVLNSLAVTEPLSAADENAVNELASLGFSKEAALRAYLENNRNEELAAEQLFSEGSEESSQVDLL